MNNVKIMVIVVVILVISLLILAFYRLKIYPLAKINTENIKIENNTVYLDILTLEQKIAQLFLVGANKRNLGLTDLNIGGIYVGGLKTGEAYRERIKEYQDKSRIRLLVATDLEGYWNPFFDFAGFPNLDEIETSKQAYNLGVEHGKILEKLGFNINFAPVAEIEDKIWEHRAFRGDVKTISEKVNSYIKGLQEQGVIATIKHYPGGSLNIKDPHLYTVRANISDEQLEVFNSALSNANAVMVGHPIVYGAVNSKNKPSSVSPEIVQDLRRRFDGLIISDDINMRCLRNKYISNEKQLFLDLINAGNDIIIGIRLQGVFPKYNINKKISYIKEAVKSGQINEEIIDGSVRRILQAKGYDVI